MSAFPLRVELKEDRKRNMWCFQYCAGHVTWYKHVTQLMFWLKYFIRSSYWNDHIEAFKEVWSQIQHGGCFQHFELLYHCCLISDPFYYCVWAQGSSFSFTVITQYRTVQWNTAVAALCDTQRHKHISLESQQIERSEIKQLESVCEVQRAQTAAVWSNSPAVNPPFMKL